MYESFELSQRRHTQRILPMVDELLRQRQQRLEELSAIAFACGPGSFTGLRIAAAVVQGLAYAAALPVIRVSTLAAMAYQQLASSDSRDLQESRYCLACLDARMDEVYVGWYGWPAPATETAEFAALQADAVLAPDALQIPQALPAAARLYMVGSGAAMLEPLAALQDFDVVRLAECEPRASAVCELAKVSWERGEVLGAEQAIPAYVRDKTTWKKRHEQ